MQAVEAVYFSLALPVLLSWLIGQVKAIRGETSPFSHPDTLTIQLIGTDLAVLLRSVCQKEHSQ